MSDCIEATQRPNNAGYPMTSGHGHRMATVHRLAWEDAHGLIPEGLEIHHVCLNKRCKNVSHMVLMTRAEHMTEHQRLRQEKGCPKCGGQLVRHSSGSGKTTLRCLACRRQK